VLSTLDVELGSGWQNFAVMITIAIIVRTTTTTTTFPQTEFGFLPPIFLSPFFARHSLGGGGSFFIF
jgi:hypothetical protein